MLADARLGFFLVLKITVVFVLIFVTPLGPFLIWTGALAIVVVSALLVIVGLTAYRLHQNRAGYAVGVGAACTMYLTLTFVANFATTTLIVQNYRVSVEDEGGAELGAGVWQLRSQFKHDAGRTYWLGEAFRVKATHGYVFCVPGRFPRSPYDWDEIFERTGLRRPKTTSHAKAFNDRMTQFNTMKNRVLLKPDQAPRMIEMSSLEGAGHSDLPPFLGPPVI